MKLEEQQASFQDCVVSVPASTLSESEMSLLSKGLKFVPTPREVPIREIITVVDEVAGVLGDEAAEELQHEAKQILKKSRKPSSNLTREERQAFGTLKAKKGRNCHPTG